MEQDLSEITDAFCTDLPKGVVALGRSTFEDKSTVSTCLYQIAYARIEGDILQYRLVDIQIGEFLLALLAHPQDSGAHRFGRALAKSALDYNLITSEDYWSLGKMWA